MTPEEKRLKTLKVGKAFSPASPIHEKDVFAGRGDQIAGVIDAINQTGQHVLIYGERGVGKTSLSNVLRDFLAGVEKAPILAPKVNCDSTDDFSSVWRKVFDEVTFMVKQRSMGFKGEVKETTGRASEGLPNNMTPNDIVGRASGLSTAHLFIPVIDEFDRLTDPESTMLMTETIKTLSDRVPHTTVVLIGVADTVDELVSQHESIQRALVQVRMPRMSTEESEEIIAKGLKKLNMAIDSEAMHLIVSLSQGLPHYTHLLSLHSARSAIGQNLSHIRKSNVSQAVGDAISKAQQSLQRAYHKATMSPRKEALYGAVLLAAALADTDDLGYFAAADLREPMKIIMKKRYEIPAFSRHLSEFCKDDRGPVLEKTGEPRRYRYRFTNPILQPYVIMKGIDSRLIKDDVF
jgi:Cdc6-like AAA superfamily ATPase